MFAHSMVPIMLVAPLLLFSTKQLLSTRSFPSKTKSCGDCCLITRMDCSTY
ncbi:hypothetical protein PF004_g23284 [Phytophthora fragariae]|uniref:Uncharacterized protein n=1 Tax=Phytophthora fragariae TaxID=53985 RepID=A0A6G0QRM5_9STRA|nr:hypothetical protein PF004_g23284 [Phytophthora fragariae]KAE9298458.1 hypothetical protein PF008_g23498 [Phytophthora fragariae]